MLIENGSQRASRVRSKSCGRCEREFPVLYRVKHQRDGDWEFLCRPCLEEVRLGNVHYQYGGTWKSHKRR